MGSLSLAAGFGEGITLGFGRSVQGAFDQGETSLLLADIPEQGTAELLTGDGVDASEVVLLKPG